MRRRAVVGLAAAAAGLAPGCQTGHPPQPAIQVVGETVKLRPDQAVPATSPFFDGTRVRVRAARGEVVGLQVLRADPAPTRIALELDGAAIRAWQVEDVRVVRPSTSLWGPSGGAGAYPDRLVPGVKGAVTAGRDALFDVAVPPATAPGDHDGTLTVGDRRIPVTLTVEPVTIPTVDAAPWVWAYYSAEELARGEGVRPGSPDAAAAERRDQRLLRSYGVYATPELTLADADRRADAVRGVRFVPVLLPRGRDAIQAAARAWPARLEPGQRAFAIPIDEPRTVVDKLAVRVLGRWLHQAGGGVWLAVTDGPDWLYGDDVDVLVSPAAPGTGPPDRRWTYNGAPPGAGAMIVDTDGVALRTWGWIGWRRRSRSGTCGTRRTGATATTRGGGAARPRRSTRRATRSRSTTARTAATSTACWSTRAPSRACGSPRSAAGSRTGSCSRRWPGVPVGPPPTGSPGAWSRAR